MKNKTKPAFTIKTKNSCKKKKGFKDSPIIKKLFNNNPNQRLKYKWQ